jgi:predicted transcriptional regulator
MNEAAAAHEERRSMTVRLPEGLHEAVENCARASGMSFNAAVAAALIEFVSTKEHREQVASFFQEGLARHEVLLKELGS